MLWLEGPLAGYHVAKLQAQSTILQPDRCVLNKYVTAQKALQFRAVKRATLARELSSN